MSKENARTERARAREARGKRAGGSGAGGDGREQLSKPPVLSATPDRAQGWRRGAGGGGPRPRGDAAARLPRPRPLHLRGAVPRLRTPLARPGSRAASSPGLRRPGQQPLRPQRPPAARASDPRALLAAFPENRFGVAEPPANGATGTREGRAGSATWGAAAPGAGSGAAARGSAG